MREPGKTGLQARERVEERAREIARLWLTGSSAHLSRKGSTAAGQQMAERWRDDIAWEIERGRDFSQFSPKARAMMAAKIRDENPRLPGSKKRDLEFRNFLICGAVRQIHGDCSLPATSLKTTSACLIVAEVLEELGHSLQAETVEAIWKAHRALAGV